MNTYKLGLLGLVLSTVISCSTDSPDILKDDIIDQLQTQLEIAVDEQEPAEILDNKKEGIYHGVVASGETQSRGKVWLNLGNNTDYTATIKMVGGKELLFRGEKEVGKENVSYRFSGAAGSFKVTQETVNKPKITDVVINNEPYFMYAIKSTSQNRATAYTGTFNYAPAQFYSGTWNILSNGTFNPNGAFGVAISDVVVTWNGNMATDTVFETASFPCAAVANWVPIVDIIQEPNEGIIALGQTSPLFGGQATWDLIYSELELGVQPGYYDENCNVIPYGTYTWTNGTVTRNGSLLLD